MASSEGHAKKLYKSLSGSGALPLEPNHPYYVPILEERPEKDPIHKLAQRIGYAESESVDLLTGFRGNGKSTQLMRLEKLLEAQGCQVFRVDMIDYVFMTKPVELSDFILSLMAALSAKAQSEAGLDTVARSYGERLWQFLKSEVEVEDAEIGAEGLVGAKLGIRLKTEASFKERVQEKLRGRLTRLVEDARLFVSNLVDAVRKTSRDPDKKVVLLVDSIEQLRGVGTDARLVHESVVSLFSGDAANLSFPKLHVVYTIPPYLLPLAPNLGRNLGGHPVTVWPNIHVREKSGKGDPDGFRVVEQVIAKRCGSWEAVLSRAQLQRLALSSGGDLRDLFRLVRETALALDIARLSRPDAVVEDRMLNDVEQQLRNELAPGSDEDAKWLANIHRSKAPSLPSSAELPTLARFFDGNMIMNYLNGDPWYDIHPLLVPEVERREKALAAGSPRKQ